MKMKEVVLGYFTAILLIVVGAVYVDHEFGIINLLNWLCDNCWDIQMSMSDFTNEVGQWLSYTGHAKKDAALLACCKMQPAGRGATGVFFCFICFRFWIFLKNKSVHSSIQIVDK